MATLSVIDCRKRPRLPLLLEWPSLVHAFVKE
jgi:hypothetical protein